MDEKVEQLSDRRKDIIRAVINEFIHATDVEKRKNDEISSLKTDVVDTRIELCVTEVKVKEQETEITELKAQANEMQAIHVQELLGYQTKCNQLKENYDRVQEDNEEYKSIFDQMREFVNKKSIDVANSESNHPDPLDLHNRGGGMVRYRRVTINQQNTPPTENHDADGEYSASAEPAVYTCGVCNVDFPTYEILQEHNNKKNCIVCPICNKRLATKFELELHAQCHTPASSIGSENGTETQQFICNEPNCSKKYRCKAALNKHMKSHNEDKEYQCPDCPKSFVQKTDLTRHLRTHTGEKPRDFHKIVI